MYQNKIQFEQLLTGISLKCSETACLCWHWPKFYTVMEPLHVHNVSQFPIFTQTACMQTYTYTSIEMRFGSTLDLQILALYQYLYHE